MANDISKVVTGILVGTALIGGVGCTSTPAVQNQSLQNPVVQVANNQNAQQLAVQQNTGNTKNYAVNPAAMPNAVLQQAAQTSNDIDDILGISTPVVNNPAPSTPLPVVNTQVQNVQTTNVQTNTPVVNLTPSISLPSAPTIITSSKTASNAMQLVGLGNYIFKPGQNWSGYYAPGESPFGDSLGKDGLRLTLSGMAGVDTNFKKLGERLRFEIEPISGLRGLDGLRLDFDIRNTNTWYDRGLDTQNLDLGLAVNKYWKVGDGISILTGLDYKFSDWNSNGDQAPDSIDTSELGIRLGLKSKELMLFARYANIFDGEFELFDVKNDVSGNNLFLSAVYSPKNTDLFIGLEYKREDTDFDNVRKLVENTYKLPFGIEDVGPFSMIGLAPILLQRNDSVGDNENLWGVEAKARLYSKKHSSWVDFTLYARQGAENDDKPVTGGIMISGGVSF